VHIRNHIANGLLLGLTFALALQSQTITTVGGNTSWGRVNNVSIDSAGNLYAADYNIAVVYKVTPQGATTVVAGTPSKPGYSGDGGPATTATLSGPLGTAVAPDGTLYIADYNNDRIRKVSPAGIITTFAGTGVGGFPIGQCAELMVTEARAFEPENLERVVFAVFGHDAEQAFRAAVGE